jgi:hypothetical protein
MHRMEAERSQNSITLGAMSRSRVVAPRTGLSCGPAFVVPDFG